MTHTHTTPFLPFQALLVFVVAPHIVLLLYDIEMLLFLPSLTSSSSKTTPEALPDSRFLRVCLDLHAYSLHNNSQVWNPNPALPRWLRYDACRYRSSCSSSR